MINQASEIASVRPRVQRLCVNAFICVLLFLFVADTIPVFLPFQQRLKVWIDPLLDKTGLWQEEWALFAPNAAKRNGWLRAEIEFADGTVLTWHSPRWRELTPGRRMLRFREGRFTSIIRNDDNADGWPNLADYVVRTEAAELKPDDAPTGVRLYREWWDVPPPGKPIERDPHSVEIYHRQVGP